MISVVCHDDATTTTGFPASGKYKCYWRANISFSTPKGNHFPFNELCTFPSFVVSLHLIFIFRSRSFVVYSPLLLTSLSTNVFQIHTLRNNDSNVPIVIKFWVNCEKNVRWEIWWDTGGAGAWEGSIAWHAKSIMISALEGKAGFMYREGENEMPVWSLLLEFFKPSQVKQRNDVCAYSIIFAFLHRSQTPARY